MHHDLPLITTLALALGGALILGFLALRLKLPALIGYLLAGVLIGPHTPGLVADTEIAKELAEIGVMLLMFGVGLHFSLDDLMSVRKIAIPGAVLQIVAATAMGTGLALYWDWPWMGALVFGLCLSVASTVVLLRALEAAGATHSINGRIAVGWLIVEDLVMVMVLVLLPPLAELSQSPVEPGQSTDLWKTLFFTLLKAAAFITLMLVVGRRFFPRLLWQIARTGSRELFVLCVVAVAVGIAYGAATLFGVSFALGAFFAGMVMRESEFSHRAAEETLPLREAFAVLFFVAVGMLFDPMILVERPLHVLMVVGIIVIGKSIAAAALVIAFRYPLNTALTVSASLAQIGEFSFILAGLAATLNILPIEGQNLILAGALISIAINPVLFSSMKPFNKWLNEHSRWARQLEHREDPLATLPYTTDASYLSGQVVLIGYGRVGSQIGRDLMNQKIPFVVVEHNREFVEQLRARDLAAVTGDATEPAVLIQAHIMHADMLVIAIPDGFNLHKIVDVARTLNPTIEIIIRSHSQVSDEVLATELKADIYNGEVELANSMSHHVLKRYGKLDQEH